MSDSYLLVLVVVKVNCKLKAGRYSEAALKYICGMAFLIGSKPIIWP